MVLNRKTTRTFHRTLYATELESVTLFKRKDDQRGGVITTYVLYQCRWSRVHKQGQILGGDFSTGEYKELHIPVIELDRVGVPYINAADKFLDEQGRYWEPESDSAMRIQLFRNHWCVMCHMTKGLQLQP